MLVRADDNVERANSLNLYAIERVLPIPTQEEVRTDGVTLC
ncbi:hypothetical protein BH09MYX1_BH09MYX1_27850 [soil metagenome]